jgi:small nuclear ribonucleoprotein E
MLFRLLQNQNNILIRLKTNLTSSLVGKLIGFDEFMNLVIDNAYEINSSNQKKFVGQLMVKGDCVVTVSVFNENYLK